MEENVELIDYQRVVDALAKRMSLMERCIREFAAPCVLEGKYKLPAPLQIEAMKLLAGLPNKWIELVPLPEDK